MKRPGVGVPAPDSRPDGANDNRFWGYRDRECGEHRTVGAHRAYCFDCSEWCYPRPDGACKGCELPMLRAEVARLRAAPAPGTTTRGAADEIEVVLRRIVDVIDPGMDDAEVVALDHGDDAGSRRRWAVDDFAAHIADRLAALPDRGAPAEVEGESEDPGFLLMVALTSMIGRWEDAAQKHTSDDYNRGRWSTFGMCSRDVRWHLEEYHRQRAERRAPDRGSPGTTEAGDET